MQHVETAAVRVLVVGDVHVRDDVLSEIEDWANELVDIILKHEVHFLVLLGDTFHYHSRLTMKSIGCITDQILVKLARHTNLVMLVGNHERESSNVLLPKLHSFYMLTALQDAFPIVLPFEIVARSSYNVQMRALMLPFVPNGQFWTVAFVAAWCYGICTDEKPVSVIFAHQDFEGSTHSATQISFNGDTLSATTEREIEKITKLLSSDDNANNWAELIRRVCGPNAEVSLDNATRIPEHGDITRILASLSQAQVFSGHIHLRQTLADGRIRYVGSSRQTRIGEKRPFVDVLEIRSSPPSAAAQSVMMPRTRRRAQNSSDMSDESNTDEENSVSVSVVSSIPLQSTSIREAVYIRNAYDRFCAGTKDGNAVELDREDIDELVPYQEKDVITAVLPCKSVVEEKTLHMYKIPDALRQMFPCIEKVEIDVLATSKPRAAENGEFISESSSAAETEDHLSLIDYVTSETALLVTPEITEQDFRGMRDRIFQK